MIKTITLRIDGKTFESLEKMVNASGKQQSDFLREMVDEKITGQDLKQVIREQIDFRLGVTLAKHDKKIDDLYDRFAKLEHWFAWLKANLDTDKPS